MDVQKLAELAITSGLSGVTSFAGAFLRFKQRLATAEEGTKVAKDAAFAAEARAVAAEAKASDVERALNAMAAGWRLEMNGFKEEFERELRHRDQLFEVRAEVRQSRPDISEDFKRELDKLKETIDKLKDKQGRYVQNATFTEHVRLQEAQWKEIAKTLGRLEALVED